VAVLKYDIWIEASPDDVWAVYTDLDRIPEWQTGAPRVAEANGSGDVVGTTYLVRRGPMTSRSMITAADRPGHHASHTQAVLGLTFDLVADLTAADGGTRLALEARTEWPRGLRLLGRAVESALLSEREAVKELTNLKTLVEREAGRR
jgi:uncharacterized protein YndB with AHSA1/START domain